MITTQNANSTVEREKTALLLQITFEEIFKGFNYKKVAELSPKFKTKTFYSYSEATDEILSTATISFLTENGKLPSEVYFGFKIPRALRKSNLVELGKLCKKINNNLPKEESRLLYISLLLAIKEYSQQNNIEYWVASVHENLLLDIQKIGIPVTILSDKVQVENEFTRAMGNYCEKVFFIFATMEDSFKALEKFEYLIQNGTISIEIEEPAFA